MELKTLCRRLGALVVSAVLVGGGMTVLAQPAAAAPAPTSVAVDARSVDFDDGWRFALGDPDGAQEPGFDDSSWESVQVPHDWSIHQDFAPGGSTTSNEGLLPAGDGWYRKSFTLPESASGKRISVDFDGVMGVTQVFLNGQQLGVHNYGYTSFSFDITDLVRTDGGANVIAVGVSNIKPNSRWYTGSGIYRDVTLTVTDTVHVDRHGTYVTTPTLEADVSNGVANVAVETTIANDSGTEQNVALETSVIDASGVEVANGVSPAKSVASAGAEVFSQSIAVPDPRLWSPEDPYLYTVISNVTVDGSLVDTYQTVTGLRSFRVDGQGAYLNGEPFVIRGMNMHHDLGALGAAVNRSAVKRQLEILKSAGVNSVRISHNPGSRVLIEEAEKLGITLLEEAFDQWRVAKTSNDYSQFFPTDAKQDIQEMVQRDKNSPAVIMWSIGNEIPINVASPDARVQAIQDAQNLNQWVKEIDTTRPTTWGEQSQQPSDPYAAIRNVLDIPGVNYGDRNTLRSISQSHPNGVVLQTEASWGFRSRGYYYNPKGLIGRFADLVDPVNGQPTYPESWQASSYDNEFPFGVPALFDSSTSLRHVYEEPRVLGSYLWSGFDYFGETAPYASVTARTNANGELEQPKNSYSGMVDTAGFKKDLYYLYQSQWTTEPMVHLLPQWNWATGDTVTVWAYTNADSVKLYLNDQLIEEKAFETKTGPRGEYRVSANGKLYLTWDVPFQPGTLRAEAYRDGQLVAKDVVSTAGAPAKLALTPDRSTASPDGEELVFITADVLDKKGVLVPDADNRITFDVTGGEIVGVDNGNPISLERYADSNVRRAFSGKALVIVRPDGTAPHVTVTATAEANKGSGQIKAKVKVKVEKAR
ncbi:glycoside hydrolase family 2 TIM barrel-domain containing protein [Agromyces bracchium]|uniref:DUF4982 domain-containing protein n=1 Tax=Agromyces bracchium TaxID=88376 RepID=A0A6I3MGN3_9MICO|nr:glycoside hydrolase family 2 TIM barrel-domain containing protein [Agromyces bracchium]MTH69453.1 DUF4982 domain-containing protein [Agromyces bracchium]